MMRLSFRGGSRDFTKGKKRGKSAASPSGAGYTTLKEVLAGGLWVRCGTAVGRSRLGPCSCAIPSHFTRANPFETRCGFHRSFLLCSFVSVLLIRLHGHTFQVQGACQIPPVQPPRFLLVAGSPESRPCLNPGICTWKEHRIASSWDSISEFMQAPQLDRKAVSWVLSTLPSNVGLTRRQRRPRLFFRLLRRRVFPAGLGRGRRASSSGINWSAQFPGSAPRAAGSPGTAPAPAECAACAHPQATADANPLLHPSAARADAGFPENPPGQ